MKWTKNFPFRDGRVILLMPNNKRYRGRIENQDGDYKIVDDIITSRIYPEIPTYLKSWIDTGKDICQHLPDGTYRIFGMTRTSFSNVLAYIYKDDLIEEYQKQFKV